MNLVKVALVVFWNVHLAVALVCTIERNHRNPTPYVLKVLRDDKFICHGALITPKLVFTPKSPLDDITKTTYSKLKFVGTKVVKYGEMSCEVEVQMAVPGRHSTYDGLNVTAWELAEGFPVMSINPYVWSKFEDLEDASGVKTVSRLVQDVGVNEACTLPVYRSRAVNASIKTEEVEIVNHPISDVWARRYCQSGLGVLAECTTRDKDSLFFGYFVSDEPRDWTYYGGAVVSCFGTPLGIFSTVIGGEPTNIPDGKRTINQVIVFDSINAPKSFALRHAQREWVNNDCVLETDRYNFWPFALKMIRRDKMVGHGVLITPKMVISTGVPYRDIQDTGNQKGDLRIMATRYNGNGVRQCDAERNMKDAVLSWTGPPGQDVIFWDFENAFDVTTNHPYPWHRLSQLYGEGIRAILDLFETSGIFEPCTLLVYASNALDATINVDVVKILMGPQKDQWLQRFCQRMGHDYQRCLNEAPLRRFFGYFELEEPPDWSWYGGAVVSCWGHRLGMFSTIIGSENFDGYRERQVILFDSFQSMMGIIRGKADVQWPV